jgi:hypothetical protein
MKQPDLPGFTAILALVFLVSTSVFAQTTSNGYRVVENRIQVDTSPEIAWKILADFSGVSEFHALFDESSLLRGREGHVELGVERETHMPEGITNVILKERVTEVLEGSYYTYTVYEWENIQLEGMRVTYGVAVNEYGQTEIYNRTAYRLRSRMMTGLARGKFDRRSKDGLISYKFFIETGHEEKDLKKLRNWHRKRLTEPEERDFIVSNDRENQ